LIREVNRLHDLLNEMTESLERNVLEMKRKVDDLARNRTVYRGDNMYEETEISIKEAIVAPDPHVRSVTFIL